MDFKKELNQFYNDLSFYELEVVNRDAAQQHINYNSLLYLNLIAYHEDCTASYLARVLNISNGAVTLKINELIRQGLVQREQSVSDRRMYYLKLTDKAEQRYRPFEQDVAALATEVEKRFSANEIEAFCRVARTFSQICSGEVRSAV